MLTCDVDINLSLLDPSFNIHNIQARPICSECVTLCVCVCLCLCLCACVCMCVCA